MSSRAGRTAHGPRRGGAHRRPGGQASSTSRLPFDPAHRAWGGCPERRSRRSSSCSSRAASRSPSAEMPSPLTTSSFSTRTPPVAMAPSASSSWPGTPSLRTRNTSSGAGVARLPRSDRDAAARQGEDEQVGTVSVGGQRGGENTPRLGAVTQGVTARAVSDAGSAPSARRGRAGRLPSPPRHRPRKRPVRGPSARPSKRTGQRHSGVPRPADRGRRSQVCRSRSSRRGRPRRPGLRAGVSCRRGCRTEASGGNRRSASWVMQDQCETARPRRRVGPDEFRRAVRAVAGRPRE